MTNRMSRPQVSVERLEHRRHLTAAGVVATWVAPTNPPPAVATATAPQTSLAGLWHLNGKVRGTGTIDDAFVNFIGTDAALYMAWAGNVYVGSLQGKSLVLKTIDAKRTFVGTLDGTTITGVDTSTKGSVEDITIKKIVPTIAVKVAGGKVVNGQTEFFLTSDAAGGHMPRIVADASVGNATQTTANTTFTWTAEIKLDHTKVKNAVRDEDQVFSLGTTKGGHLDFPSDKWAALQVGTLTLTAVAPVDGVYAVSSPVPNLAILGENPPLADVRAALGTDTLRRMAHQESNFRQFGADGMPLFSKDHKDGGGEMQITPLKGQDEWNWRANVKEGIDTYNHCYDLTNTYVKNMQSSPLVKTAIDVFNKVRATKNLPAVKVTIPDFTADERMRDALRGYNGWTGSDPIDSRYFLHEFRLERDAAGVLVVNVVGATGTAIWEEVPSSERPAKGDPNYVNDVLAETP